MDLTYTESDWQLPEPDEWLPAKIDRVEEGQDYGFGPTLKIVLHLDGDIDQISGEQRETWAMCSTLLTPRSKLYGWIKSIDPAMLPSKGGSFNTDTLAGLAVDVMFEHGENSEGMPRAKVVKMRSSKKPVAAGKIKAEVTRKDRPKLAEPDIDDNDLF